MPTRIRDRSKCLSLGVHALARCNNSRAIKFLSHLAHTPSTPDTLRREVLIALSDMPPESLHDKYIELAVTSEDSKLHIASVRALGHIPGPFSKRAAIDVMQMYPKLYPDALKALMINDFDGSMPLLKEALRSKDPHIRIAALESCSLKKDPRLIRNLAALQRDSDERVLVALVDTYRKTDRCRDLLTMLRIPNPTVKLVTLAALASVPTPDVMDARDVREAIENHIDDSNEIVRLGALRAIDFAGPRTISKLISCWKDLHVFYYPIATECMERIVKKDSEARNAVKEIIYKQLALRMAYTFLSSKTDEPFYWLIKVLKGIDSGWKTKIIHEIDSLNDKTLPDAEPGMLRHLMHHKHSVISSVLTRLLESIGRPEDLKREKLIPGRIIGLMLGCLSSKDKTFTHDEIRLLINSTDSSIRESSLKIVADENIQMDRDFLLKTLRDRSVDVKVAVGRIASTLPGIEGAEILNYLAMDKSLEVRLETLKIIKDSSCFIDTHLLKSILKSLHSKQYREVQKAAELAAKRNLKDVAVELEACLNRDSIPLKASVLAALNKLGYDSAFKALLEMLDDEDKMARRAAMEALSGYPLMKIFKHLFRSMGDVDGSVSRKACALLDHFRSNDSVELMISEFERIEKGFC